MKLSELNAKNCKFVIKEPIGKEIRGIIAGTNIDKHNHKLTLEQLKKMAEDLKSNPFMNNEHDSSKTPLGKVINFEIRSSDNGEYELHIVCTLFLLVL